MTGGVSVDGSVKNAGLQSGWQAFLAPRHPGFTEPSDDFPKLLELQVDRGVRRSGLVEFLLFAITETARQDTSDESFSPGGITVHGENQPPGSFPQKCTVAIPLSTPLCIKNLDRRWSRESTPVAALEPTRTDSQRLAMGKHSLISQVLSGEAIWDAEEKSLFDCGLMTPLKTSVRWILARLTLPLNRDLHLRSSHSLALGPSDQAVSFRRT